MGDVVGKCVPGQLGVFYLRTHASHRQQKGLIHHSCCAERLPETDTNPCKGGYTLVTLPRIVTPYRDSVDGTRDRLTYQKLVTAVTLQVWTHPKGQDIPMFFFSTFRDGLFRPFANLERSLNDIGSDMHC
jgi:hypothetical protein